jgi:hypothetical protein
MSRLKRHLRYGCERAAYALMSAVSAADAPALAA